jgi:hypothetical protein
VVQELLTVVMITAIPGRGHRASLQVTAHIKLVGLGFVACTKHAAAPTWLVYDSATTAVSNSATDCV